MQNQLYDGFWNEDEERWCEECDDYLQQYIGLALLKEYQQVVDESRKDFMKQLILAEKPSVAKDLSKVLGCNQKIKLLRRTQGNRYLGPWSFIRSKNARRFKQRMGLVADGNITDGSQNDRDQTIA